MARADRSLHVAFCVGYLLGPCVTLLTKLWGMVYCALHGSGAEVGDRWMLRTYSMLRPVMPWSQDGYHVYQLEHAEDVMMELFFMVVCS